MTKESIYNDLKQVLNRTYFEFDDTNKSITCKPAVNLKDVDGIECLLMNILGNKHVPYCENKDFASFKMDANYIEVDEETIKVDKNGRLYVDASCLIDKTELLDAIMSNEDLMNQFYEKLEPTKVSVDFVGKHLLHDPRFLVTLKKLLNDLDERADTKLDDESLDNITSETISEIVDNEENGTEKLQEENNAEATTDEMAAALAQAITETASNIHYYKCPVCENVETKYFTTCPKCGIRVTPENI